MALATLDTRVADGLPISKWHPFTWSASSGDPASCWPPSTSIRRGPLCLRCRVGLRLCPKGPMHVPREPPSAVFLPLRSLSLRWTWWRAILGKISQATSYPSALPSLLWGSASLGTGAASLNVNRRVFWMEAGVQPDLFCHGHFFKLLYQESKTIGYLDLV